MRSYEGSTVSQATPEDAWAAWTDVPAWSAGGVVQSSRLHGTFDVGGRITTKVKGYPAGTSTITRIDRPRIWVGVAKSPGLTLTYEHVIEPAGSGSRITERAIVSGPLGGLVGRLIGARIATTFEATTAQIARQAEARAHSASLREGEGA